MNRFQGAIPTGACISEPKVVVLGYLEYTAFGWDTTPFGLRPNRRPPKVAEYRNLGLNGGTPLGFPRAYLQSERKNVPRTPRVRVRFSGAADKAANLRGESPLRSVARFGRLAYLT